MTVGAARAKQVSETRELILSAAERLFAEHGVAAVSNRQVSEAAGQGNNTAVGYHFGTKAELVAAIVRKHHQEIEDLRARMVADARGSRNVRDWVACTVLPHARHLADLGTPSWFGRFGAQAMTDPAYREIMSQESLNSPSLLEATSELNRCLSHLPAEVREDRRDMGRQLMVHVVAERERALAEGGTTARASWDQAATGLIDALTGLWLAPITTSP
ncbi:TetR/AcrR family transcriptional regulator [Saccharopolyspora gloriosae]|uniref:TetR/AcrR family transcriptional regulator n=1 Tax=Saccharopolyspora gloriosae TaxID=455344 RepID=UPI001FB659AE|nr:TetR family transcriptional regulator [Saccharopolyspora gloriosae]